MPVAGEPGRVCKGMEVEISVAIVVTGIVEHGARNKELMEG